MSRQLVHIDPRFVANMLIQGVHPNSIVREIFNYTSAKNFKTSDWIHIQNALVSIILSLSKKHSRACIVNPNSNNENFSTPGSQDRDEVLGNKTQLLSQPTFNAVSNFKAFSEKTETNAFSDEIVRLTKDTDTCAQMDGHGSNLKHDKFQPLSSMVTEQPSISINSMQGNTKTQISSKSFQPLNISLPSYYVQSFMKLLIHSLEAQNIDVAESVTELYATMLMENTFRQSRSDPNKKRLIAYPITIDAIPLARFIKVSNDGDEKKENDSNDEDDDVYYHYDIEGYDSNKFVTIEEAPNVIAAEGSTGHRTWEAALALTEYILTSKQKEKANFLPRNNQQPRQFEKSIETVKMKIDNYIETNHTTHPTERGNIYSEYDQQEISSNKNDSTFTLLPHYKNIIEIGAGTGLTGIVAASHLHAQKLILTDGDDSVVSGLSKAIERNMAMLENNFKANKTYYYNDDKDCNPKFVAKRLFWGSNDDLENVLEFISTPDSCNKLGKKKSACLINPNVISTVSNNNTNNDNPAEINGAFSSGNTIHAFSSSSSKQQQESTLILAADVTYDSFFAPVLFQTLSDLLNRLTSERESYHSVHILLAATVRSQTTLEEFIEIAKSPNYGFNLKMEPIKKYTFNNERSRPSKYYYFPPSAPDILIFSISKM